eukprot:347064_1
MQEWEEEDVDDAGIIQTFQTQKLNYKSARGRRNASKKKRGKNPGLQFDHIREGTWNEFINKISLSFEMNIESKKISEKLKNDKQTDDEQNDDKQNDDKQ